VLKYFLSFRTFEQLVACPEKQSVPWIHCIEYIYFLITPNFEQLAHALKNRVSLKIFTALKYFYLSGFLRKWNFSLYLIYFLHSGCLSNCCLPWKTECALNSLYWMYFYPSEFWTTCACLEKHSLPWKFSLHWNKDFWGTCACSENRVFPEIYHCIEYSFYIQDFRATCAFPEKQSVPWIHCIEYIFFIIQNFEQPALALKTEFALKIFTVLKYFLSFRIFEQVELALKTEFALNFSSRWRLPPRSPPRTPLSVRPQQQLFA